PSQPSSASSPQNAGGDCAGAPASSSARVAWMTFRLAKNAEAVSASERCSSVIAIDMIAEYPQSSPLTRANARYINILTPKLAQDSSVTPYRSVQSSILSTLK